MTFDPKTWWAMTMLLAFGVAVMLGMAGLFFHWLKTKEHQAVAVLCWSFSAVWTTWALMHLGLIMGQAERPPWFSTILAAAIFLPCVNLVYRLFRRDRSS